MKQANPVSDDMFQDPARTERLCRALAEKAREAFFGTAKTLPKDDRSNRIDSALEHVEVIAQTEKVLTA